jgi:succinyl-diaminopimelate desuccinylase
MNKKVHTPNRRDLAEFADRLAAKWQLRVQATHAQVSDLESSEEILRDLVSIPTVTGNYETNHECFDYLERFFTKHGLYVKRYEWNGIESIVASTRRTKTPTVCMFGHIDVVPGPDELFQLHEKDNKYYGRGVLDMKGGVAAFLGAIQKLGDDIQEYDIAVALTSDEEVGGFDGAARLAEEGFRPKMIILPDGGANWNLERFAKGIWHITVEAVGRSAHGSRPWEGENAIEKVVDVVARIKALFPNPMSMETSTLNVGIIQGGNAINQIPATATASMDLRFSSTAEQTRLTAAIKALVDQTEGVTITTEVEADAMTNDPNDPFLKEFAACTEAVIGRPPEWIVSNAGNDGRFFAKHGIPCAIAYPPGANHHGAEEYIFKDAFFQMQDILVTYIQSVAKRAPAKPARRKVLTVHN